MRPSLGADALEQKTKRLTEDALLPVLLRLSLPDRFMHNYGSQDSLLKKHGLAPNAIATSIEHALAASRTSSPQLHSI